jgi:hypothetical protein
MNEDHAPTPNEKLLMLSQQLDTMARVGPVDVMCPYCNGVTSPGNEFCCPMIVKALTALADARDKFGHLERYMRN